MTEATYFSTNWTKISTSSRITIPIYVFNSTVASTSNPSLSTTQNFKSTKTSITKDTTENTIDTTQNVTSTETSITKDTTENTIDTTQNVTSTETSITIDTTDNTTDMTEATYFSTNWTKTSTSTRITIPIYVFNSTVASTSNPSLSTTKMPKSTSTLTLTVNRTTAHEVKTKPTNLSITHDTTSSTKLVENPNDAQCQVRKLLIIILSICVPILMILALFPLVHFYLVSKRKQKGVADRKLSSVYVYTTSSQSSDYIATSEISGSFITSESSG
jgi:hypothetical protein